jgi:hypothetical protein
LVLVVLSFNYNILLSAIYPNSILLVDINLLTLIVRNTVIITPFRILIPYYIKEVELSIESVGKGGTWAVSLSLAACT